MKETWDEALFSEQEIETDLGSANMKLAEQETSLNGCTMREVRKISDEKHQTSIVTTNKILPLTLIAAYMFGRWVQENFFRYMRQEYSLDKIDDDFKVVNREYSNISYRIKKEQEKLCASTLSAVFSSFLTSLVLKSPKIFSIMLICFPLLRHHQNSRL